eukprot:GILK01005836.1.p1 GENE.GILK01005836.1~~GILK01005836.1.p1  ORF type:complete len:502 (-),score=108.26 GILK01005836.1:136-1641(-)
MTKTHRGVHDILDDLQQKRMSSLLQFDDDELYLSSLNADQFQESPKEKSIKRNTLRFLISIRYRVNLLDLKDAFANMRTTATAPRAAQSATSTEYVLRFMDRLKAHKVQECFQQWNVHVVEQFALQSAATPSLDTHHPLPVPLAPAAEEELLMPLESSKEILSLTTALKEAYEAEVQRLEREVKRLNTHCDELKTEMERQKSMASEDRAEKEAIIEQMTLESVSREENLARINSALMDENVDLRRQIEQLHERVEEREEWALKDLLANEAIKEHLEDLYTEKEMRASIDQERSNRFKHVMRALAVGRLERLTTVGNMRSLCRGMLNLHRFSFEQKSAESVMSQVQQENLNLIAHSNERKRQMLERLYRNFACGKLASAVKNIQFRMMASSLTRFIGTLVQPSLPLCYKDIHNRSPYKRQSFRAALLKSSVTDEDYKNKLIRKYRSAYMEQKQSVGAHKLMHLLELKVKKRYSDFMYSFVYGMLMQAASAQKRRSYLSPPNF